MKARSWFLPILCLLAFSAAQAQVVADFDVAALGTQGFADNGWGSALNSVTREADPTGGSAGVLAVDYNGTKGTSGVIEKDSFSPKNAHVLAFSVYLPADFPDDGSLQFFAQDNSHWAHTTETYNGVDIPKETWITLNFHIRGLNLASPATFDPYSPNQFGKFGVAINAPATFSGLVLFDNLTLLGDVPRVQADFETNLNGWSNSGWSAGISSVGLLTDPTDATNQVMSVGLDASLGTVGQLTSSQINLTTLDQVMAFRIWVPAEFPDENVIHIVGQDKSHWADGAIRIYTGADLVKGQWNEIYLDILKCYQIDSSKFTPYTAGGFGRVWIGFENNTTFTGSVYMDDIILCQPAPPPTATLESPVITVTGGKTDYADPFTGEVFYYNQIDWTDLSADIGETYALYYSETGPITNVAASGVIQISKHISRGTQVWYHRLYTANGASKTVYYAMTSTGLSGGAVVETPVRDGISSSGAVTAPTSKLYEIPFVSSFNFAADAYLDEFENLAKTFKRCTLKNQHVSGDAGPVAAWDTSSTDLNMTGYVVMDPENLYIGMNVIDDYPLGDGQCWAGDGFDFMSGLYDVRTLTSLWRGDDQQQGAVTDAATGGGYRIGAAIGAGQGNHIQYNGYAAWDPDGAEYAQDIFDYGYIVEMKIPIATLNAQFNGSFTPASGMILCGKIDCNDNDSTLAGAFRSLQNHWGDVPANFQGWQRAEAWAAPFILTDTPLPTAVESRESAPVRFALDRNYPNPFNPSTTVRFQMAAAGNVKLAVFDLMGRELKTLLNGRQSAGSHTIEWDGKDQSGNPVGSGVYFVRMNADHFNGVQKMLLVK
jgi:hypothetical protein